MAQDSSRPDFWDTRYRGGVTPWDAAGVPPQLTVWLQSKQAPQRVLIPGCGSGYEVRAFAAHGHDVLAVDFSDAALEAARRELGALSDRVLKADFFSFEAQCFDVVYERAFLCALPRRLWAAWARRVGELLRPGGELAGFYYLDDNPRGPPFGISEEALKQLLDPGFELAESLPVPPAQSLPVFQGKEVWQVWRRRL
ncbi:MAG TPA: methyltransferase [Burkholderiales bacterium]|nr:methyltransferase [Burkholderiales bacterium]